jgi:hypothetical protein
MNETQPGAANTQDDMKLSEAFKIVATAIKNDPSYRIGWQANIAMAYKDEHSRNPNGTIHEIANSAADRFLEQLCYDVNTQTYGT